MFSRKARHPGGFQAILQPMAVEAKIEPGAAERGVDTPEAALKQDWGRSGGGARLRPRTLVNLRWMGVIGQAFSLGFVGLVMRFPVPWLACLAVIGISAALNLVLTLTPAGRLLAGRSTAALQLAFDIIQLAALLWLTGGVANPFCLMLIAPVTLGAATLPPREALALGVLAAAFCLMLSVNFMPLPWRGPLAPVLPDGYRLAVATAVIIGVAFTAGYAWQAATESQRMELALNVTETVLAREQRLSALGALAASAAHELGTPLATISVVAREMAREAPAGPMREDALLLVSQAQRCRDILKRLAETPEASDVVHERLSLLQFLREVVEPYDKPGEVRVEAVVTGAPGVEAPDLWRQPEVLHAMTSIVENAFDFARTEILVTARFDGQTVSVEVRDDGPGFAPEVLARLGEPYVTSRPGAEGSRTGHIGMGLGFFIAKTLLERTGAAVEFGNGRRGGAVVAARWQRSRIEAAPLSG
jgi:two-component system sensor histidine kinase RegB